MARKRTKPPETSWLQEVSCVQYAPAFKNRTKDEAENIAIKVAMEALTRRGYDSGIFLQELAHRNSGHVHVVAVATRGDTDMFCDCCPEVQKLIPTRHGGEARWRQCNCDDCVACDQEIRIDAEQLTKRT